MSKQTTLTPKNNNRGRPSSRKPYRWRKDNYEADDLWKERIVAQVELNDKRLRKATTLEEFEEISTRIWLRGESNNEDWFWNTLGTSIKMKNFLSENKAIKKAKDLNKKDLVVKFQTDKETKERYYYYPTTFKDNRGKKRNQFRNLNNGRFIKASEYKGRTLNWRKLLGIEQ